MKKIINWVLLISSIALLLVTPINEGEQTITKRVMETTVSDWVEYYAVCEEVDGVIDKNRCQWEYADGSSAPFERYTPRHSPYKECII